MKVSEILAKYNTDKNMDVRRAHCYGKAYDHIFRPYDRHSSISLVEVGIEYGESLLAWRDYFTQADISGIDIEDKVTEKRRDIEYIFCDVKDYKPTKEYDIVIDDGSHKLSDVVHTVKTFKLKVGGVMVIEDCQAPNHWFDKIRKNTNYTIELVDMRKVNNQHDDFLIVLRNYGYYK